MTRYFFAILLILLTATNVAYSKDKKSSIPNYTITASGAQGTGKIVTVTIITNKPNNVNFDMLEKAAVHGLLFRGYMNSNGQLGGSNNIPPIMESPMDEVNKSDFFEPFFENGMYKSYVQEVGGSKRVMKVGKEHKVSGNVIVQEGTLRNDLIKAGVLQRFGL